MNKLFTILCLSLIISGNAFSMEWFNYFKKKEPISLDALRKDRSSFLSCLPRELFQELMKYDAMKDPSVFWALLEHRKQTKNGLLEQIIITGSRSRHFASDEKYLYAALVNGEIIKVDLEEGTQPTIHMHHKPLINMLINKKNNCLIFVTEKEIQIWDLERKSIKATIADIVGIKLVDESTHNLFVVSGNCISIVNLDTCEITKTLLEENLWPLVLDLKNKFLFVGSYAPAKIIVWDLEKNIVYKTFEIQNGCYSLYFNEISKQLILQDGYQMRLLNMQTEQYEDLYTDNLVQQVAGGFDELRNLLFAVINDQLRIFDVVKKTFYQLALNVAYNSKYMFDQRKKKLYLSTTGDIRIYSLYDRAMKAQFEQEITLDRIALLKAIYAAFLEGKKLDLRWNKQLLGVYNQWPLIHSFLGKYVTVQEEQKDEPKDEIDGLSLRRMA